MSDQKHTSEPWSISSRYVNQHSGVVIEAGGCPIVSTMATASCFDQDWITENARRIVACVNELAGKPEGYVKQLEAELAEALSVMAEVAKLYDQENKRYSDYMQGKDDQLCEVLEIIEPFLSKHQKPEES